LKLNVTISLREMSVPIYYWIAELAELAVEHVELIDLSWVYRLAELASDLVDLGELILLCTLLLRTFVTT